MSEDAMKALAEVETALKKITWARPLGETPKKVSGLIVEEVEKEAMKALSLLPTLRAALTTPANQIRALQDAIEGECDGISVSEQSARNILSYIGARAALNQEGGQ